jgi:methylated-DNA-[protein]-cysteine S-methyltransferase
VPHTEPTQFTLFDTAIGAVGIAWSATGVVGVALPEGSPSATRSRLIRSYPDAAEVRGETSAPPPAVERAIEGITALVSGSPDDLSDVTLDLTDVAEFDRCVYELAREVPPGRTTTYGRIAAQLGDPHASREVGRALGDNPVPLIVPCHRVLAAGGRLGGFSARGGVTTKLRLLDIEGAEPDGQPALF